MVCERVQGGVAGVTLLLQGAPHVQTVVVATARKMAPVRGPREPAHLLRVRRDARHQVVTDPHVVVVDTAAPRSTETATRSCF